MAFPFSEYAAIEHIPVIEVEFVHLAGLDAHLGQLTLLDTPGPNEAGQPHLQKMLSEQLARASAVLAVMDYTQLKSISDEEVRQAISVAGKSVPLYATVNKFDQKDRNSDDEEQVRAMISGTLMKGNISRPDLPCLLHVGVSGEPRSLRDEYPRTTAGSSGATLGAGFCRSRPRSPLAYGGLDDIGHIRHAADLLWEDSLFEQPIRKLIYAAYANASLFALRSASHKLLNYAQNAREYLDFRYQGLTVAFDALELNITRLEEDMAMMQTRQRVVSDEVKHEVEQALNATADFMGAQKQRFTGRLVTCLALAISLI